MNPTKNPLVTLVMAAVMLTVAPVAQADPEEGFTPAEFTYLSDVAADGMRPASSTQGLVNEGWTICRALAAGMSSGTAAQKVYSGSQSAVGVDGVTQAQALSVVHHAMDDLCPSTQAANIAT